MARYIDADALIAKGWRLERHAPSGAVIVEMSIADVPTADVVEVRHGRWVHTDYAMHWHGKDECSECTYHTFDRDDLSHFNFCPNCGARMDGDKE